MYESKPVPGELIEGEAFAQISARFMQWCCGRTYEFMRFQPPFWEHWHRDGNTHARMKPERVYQMIRNRDSWLVLNQHAEKLGRASGEEVVKFFSEGPPEGLGDMFVFDEDLSQCFALNHDDWWMLLVSAKSSPQVDP